MKSPEQKLTAPRIKLLLLLLIFITHSLAGNEFHISPLGSDSDPGSADKPFQTLAAARNAVRTINTAMKRDMPGKGELRDVGSGDNHILFNDVHHCNQIHGDGGGIYTLGGIQNGSVIAGNFVHDINQPQGHYKIDYIYLDNRTSKIIVRNNVVTGGKAAERNGSRGNTLENNVQSNSAIENNAGIKPGYTPRKEETACLVGATQILSANQNATALEDALAEVNAQASVQFDPVVTPIPDDGLIAEMPTLEILRMLESWNPALRGKVASILGERGDEVLPVLMQAADSGSGTVRAGSTQALAALIKKKLSNWKQVYPEMSSAGEAQEKILADHADLAQAFIRLCGDERVDVRKPALNGLSAMAPQIPEAALAVLELTKDEDEYLAQQAMVELNKRFRVDLLKEEVLIEGLKEAMRFPLPNGRGHIVQIISRLDEGTQRKFIPELLAHLDWQPMRDTMFSAGGREDSIKILTKLGAKELVPRLPGLMFEEMRPTRLFMVCLDSAKAFGRDAIPILSDLRMILVESEKEGFKKTRDHDQRLEKLRSTIAQIEKQ